MSAPQPTPSATPGPWIFNETRSTGFLLAITTADGTQNVAQVFGMPLGEVGHANAALIASVPALAAECERLRADVQRLRNACASAGDVLAWLDRRISNEPMNAEIIAALAIVRAALNQ